MPVIAYRCGKHFLPGSEEGGELCKFGHPLIQQPPYIDYRSEVQQFVDFANRWGNKTLGEAIANKPFLLELDSWGFSDPRPVNKYEQYTYVKEKYNFARILQTLEQNLKQI